MPYITQQRRELVVTQQPPAQGKNEPLNVGELTYQLTVVAEEYRRIHGDKFHTFACIVAALEQAKDEFQRRVAHPYEDSKLAANGDCYAAGVRDEQQRAYRQRRAELHLAAAQARTNGSELA